VRPRLRSACNARTDDSTAYARPPHLAGGVGIKTAWVGDSRAVLARYSDGAKTVVQALTRDHKASDVMEAARIEAFYAALARRPASTRSQGSDGDDGSVRLCICVP
jgi:serine/threonine protein phosphatase PrpC